MKSDMTRNRRWLVFAAWGASAVATAVTAAVAYPEGPTSYTAAILHMIAAGVCALVAREAVHGR